MTSSYEEEQQGDGQVLKRLGDVALSRQRALGCHGRFHAVNSDSARALLFVVVEKDSIFVRMSCLTIYQ